MLDVEKFLIALRSHKDPDGRLNPIFLADTVQEEIKIIQAAVENSRREWVGLTDENIHDAFNFTEMVKQLSWDREPELWCKNFAAYIEAKLKEKNQGVQ